VKTILYEIVLRDTFYAFLHYKKQTLLSAYEMLLLRLFPYHANHSPLPCALRLLKKDFYGKIIFGKRITF
ncbi:MAG: hypothetical protein QM229_10040, partial [Bacillota bacterium]|nr:hypothetical protein [Bacillota bacterium]